MIDRIGGRARGFKFGWQVVQMLSPAVATFILLRIGVPGCARINATGSVDILPLPVLSRNRAACSPRPPPKDEVAKPFFTRRRFLHFMGCEVRLVGGAIAEGKRLC